MNLTSRTVSGNGSVKSPVVPGRDPRQAATPTTTTQRRIVRNRGRIMLGVLLVAACGLVGAVAATSTSDRHPVVAVARRVPAGHAIEQADLTRSMVSVDRAEAVVPGADLGRLVGQVALVDLVPGSLLAPGQFGGSRPSTPGQAVIGATVKEGQFPMDLQIGSPVSVVILPDAAQTGAVSPLPVRATVVALGRSTQGGPMPVSLSVPPEAATGLAVAGAQGRVALVELAR